MSCLINKYTLLMFWIVFMIYCPIMTLLFYCIGSYIGMGYDLLKTYHLEDIDLGDVITWLLSPLIILLYLILGLFCNAIF